MYIKEKIQIVRIIHNQIVKIQMNHNKEHKNLQKNYLIK